LAYKEEKGASFIMLDSRGNEQGVGPLRLVQKGGKKKEQKKEEGKPVKEGIGRASRSKEGGYSQSHV
jgi:hypothetical protein